MRLEPLGDSAVLATLGDGIDAATLEAVLDFADALASAKRTGITDIVPAYESVAVFYEPARFAEVPGDPYDAVCAFIESCVGRPTNAPFRTQSKLVEIPVCYASTFGPDLEAVAAHCKLSAADVVAIHTDAEYRVHAIGFTPGFPYLGGLPETLRTPRRDTPRGHVPAGSVAIGGSQTGIYPVDSPGGWHIIGRTPLQLFSPARQPAALLRPGDRVRFKPIWASEFSAWK
jgi:inhibitor of KinA